MKNGDPGKIVAKVLLHELALDAASTATSMAATGWTAAGNPEVHDGAPYLQPVGAKSFVLAVSPRRWAVVDGNQLHAESVRWAAAGRSVNINTVPGVEFFDSVRDANDRALERS